MDHPGTLDESVIWAELVFRVLVEKLVIGVIVDKRRYYLEKISN
jgi:hypothetical protein